jgi:hypothetical protein
MKNPLVYRVGAIVANKSLGTSLSCMSFPLLFFFFYWKGGVGEISFSKKNWTRNATKKGESVSPWTTSSHRSGN